MKNYSIYKKLHRGAVVLSTGLVLSLTLGSVQVDASTILPSAGIASFLESNYTVAQYVELAKEAEGALWGYTNLGIANVEDANLNVRETPSTSGRLVGKMPQNSACEIIEEADGWAHIKSGEVEGYVSMEYLLTGPDAKLIANDLVRTVAVVNVDALNVRDEASEKSAVLTQVPKDAELDYVESLEGWIKIELDSQEAYVSAEYVTIKEKLDTAVTMTELLYGEGVSDVRVEMVEYAKQFLGNPYVWGGTSLTKGADCSGFVLSVYKKFGVKLPHYSGSQANSGTKISFSEIQPGDLIFYADSNGKINHVTMYIGNNQVIHASSPKNGIMISKYNYRTPVKYVRILED